MKAQPAGMHRRTAPVGVGCVIPSTFPEGYHAARLRQVDGMRTSPSWSRRPVGERVVRSGQPAAAE